MKGPFICGVCVALVLVLGLPLWGQMQNDRPSTVSKDEIIARMLKSIRAKPYLHLTASIYAENGPYEIQAWMSVSRSRSEVRQSGRLVYAQSVGEGRIQEFVPRGGFKNGTKARNVLLEYDSNPKGPPSDWPRLVDQKLACEYGDMLDSWLRPDPEGPPEVLANLISSGEMSDSTLGEKLCYLFRSEFTTAKDTTVCREVFVDRATYEPLCRVISSRTRDGKTSVGRTVFRLEHLDTDEQIVWRLDPATLRAAPNRRVEELPVERVPEPKPEPADNE